MTPIRFYKNGKLLYELHKIGNLYILKDIKTNKAKSFNDIPPKLENLLPEGINKELCAIKNNVSIHNHFKLLGYIDDAFGRISTNNAVKKEVEFNIQINSYKESIKYVEDFKEIEELLLESFEYSYAPKDKAIKLSYLSGQQPKTSIIVKKGHIRFAQQQEHSNAILKYSNKKFHLINVIENMFLNFAKFELGFDVSPTFLLIDRQLRKSDFLRDTLDMLITKRFDDTDGDYFEINSLLGYLSEEKYNIPVEEIFDSMQKYLSKEELEKLAKYYYFNFLVRNGDTHAKNFSVIKQGDMYRLSPLYDVVNTHIYGYDYSLGIPLRKNSFNEYFSESDLILLLSNYIDVDILKRIKKIVANKIEDYINQTPFEVFEKGKLVKQKLLDSLQTGKIKRRKKHHQKNCRSNLISP